MREARRRRRKLGSPDRLSSCPSFRNSCGPGSSTGSTPRRGLALVFFPLQNSLTCSVLLQKPILTHQKERKALLGRARGIPREHSFGLAETSGAIVAILNRDAFILILLLFISATRRTSAEQSASAGTRSLKARLIAASPGLHLPNGLTLLRYDLGTFDYDVRGTPAATSPASNSLRTTF